MILDSPSDDHLWLLWRIKWKLEFHGYVDKLKIFLLGKITSRYFRSMTSDDNWIIKFLRDEKSWFCADSKIATCYSILKRIFFSLLCRQLPVPYGKVNGGATSIPLPATVQVTRRTPDKRSLPVPNGQTGIAKYPSGTPSSESSRPNSPPDFKSGIRWVCEKLLS